MLLILLNLFSSYTANGDETIAVVETFSPVEETPAPTPEITPPPTPTPTSTPTPAPDPEEIIIIEIPLSEIPVPEVANIDEVFSYNGFVDITDIDPRIVLDIRFAEPDN